MAGDCFPFEVLGRTMLRWKPEPPTWVKFYPLCIATPDHNHSTLMCDHQCLISRSVISATRGREEMSEIEQKSVLQRGCDIQSQAFSTCHNNNLGFVYNHRFLCYYHV
jgi:hypothetical protein